MIRLANFRFGRAMHIGIQMLAWCAALGALGLGIYLAVDMNMFATAHAHPILGIIILLLILCQPLYGWLHHRAFKAHGRRSFLSWAHLGVGRAAIVFGMINGGLGLQLAGRPSQRYVMRYSIVCGVFAVLYIAAIVYGELRLERVRPNKRSFQRVDSGEKAGMRGLDRTDEQGLAVLMTPRPFRPEERRCSARCRQHRVCALGGKRTVCGRRWISRRFSSSISSTHGAGPVVCASIEGRVHVEAGGEGRRRTRRTIHSARKFTIGLHRERQGRSNGAASRHWNSWEVRSEYLIAALAVMTCILLCASCLLSWPLTVREAPSASDVKVQPHALARRQNFDRVKVKEE